MARLARRPTRSQESPTRGGRCWCDDRASRREPTVRRLTAARDALASARADRGRGRGQRYAEDALPPRRDVDDAPMPADPRPATPTAAEPWPATVAAFLARHRLTALVVAFGLIVLLGVASAGARDVGVTAPATTPTTDVVGVDPTTTTTIPTTTSTPEETRAPGAARAGTGNGEKGKGEKGKGGRRRRLTRQEPGVSESPPVAHLAVEVVDLLADPAQRQLLRVLLGHEPLAAQRLDREAVDPGLGDLGHRRLARLGLHDVGRLGRPGLGALVGALVDRRLLHGEGCGHRRRR